MDHKYLRYDGVNWIQLPEFRPADVNMIIKLGFHKSQVTSRLDERLSRRIPLRGVH
jgi:hypothetical protein